MKRYLILALVLLIALAMPVSAVEYVYTGQTLSMGDLTLQEACQAGWGQNAGTSNPATESFDIDIYYQGGLVRVARHGPGGAWTYPVPASSTVYYPTYNYVIQSYSFLCSGGWKTKSTVDFYPYLGAKVIGPAGAAPVNFVGSPLEGPPPLTVNFAISNYFATSTRNWSFGDGQYETGSSSSTSHLYSNAGDYDVVLRYTNSSGTYYVTKNGYIKVMNAAPPHVVVNCNSLLEPGTVGSPYNLICTDNSTTYPSYTARGWLLGYPDGTFWVNGGDVFERTLVQEGIYALNFTKCNSMGCNYWNTTNLVTISGISSSGPYSIALGSSSINYGETTTGTILGNHSKITAYRWYIYYPGQAMPDDFYETGTYRTLNYVDRTGTWMGWDDDTRDFSNNKGGTMPNPVNLYPKYSGQNLLVGCFIFLDDGSMVNPTARLTVGDGQGLQKITFIAEDAETGSFVSPVTYSILRHSTGTWQNLSEVRPGQVDVEYPTSSTLTAYAYPPAGSEYSVGSITYQVWDTPGYAQGVHIDMWKGASTNVSETTAYLSVIKNDGWAKIPGASIQLSDGQSCTTPSTGTCKLTLQNSTSYSATVSATGYHTNTFYFFVEGAGYQRAFQMVQIGATATPTLTIPVTTPPGGGGTPTPTGTGIVPGGVPTLNPSQKRQAVDKAGAIWFEYAEFLSYLIFLAVVFTILGTFEWKRRRGGKK